MSGRGMTTVYVAPWRNAYPAGRQTVNLMEFISEAAMTTADPVGDLLLRWEDARRRGASIAPEELCSDCPELLDELRSRVAALESMSDLLGRDDSRTLIGPADGGTAAADHFPVAGRYRPVRAHARGGLGEVLLAEDGELRRPVALKRILPPYADSPLARRRFLREAEITARLQHPGIVPVYGLTTDTDGRPCYAMRFIEGESLADALARFHKSSVVDFGSLDFRTLLQRFVAACNAIAYAHARGVVHRDLKPSNVMLGPFGETLVVDWGLAKELPVEDRRDRADKAEVASYSSSPFLNSLPKCQSNDATQPGSVIGTPAYMAPEQASGDDTGPAADVFSLGATLYALVTGQSPFQAPSAPAALEKARSASFLPARSIRADVPTALDAICQKAMARDPTARYATALTLAADVERWLADEPVSARRDPWRDRIRRWMKRHRPLVAGMAVLLAAAVVGIVVVGIREASASRRIAAERDAAVTARARTRQALDDMTSPVALAGMRSQQKILPEQEAFLGRALVYYQEFAAENAADTNGRRLLADAKLRVAAMLQLLRRGSEAEAEYRAAAEMYERLAVDRPTDFTVRAQQAATLLELGDAISDQPGRRAEVEAAFRQSLAVAQQLVLERPTDASLSRQALASRRRLATLLRGTSERRPESVAEFRRAVADAETLAGQPGSTALDRLELANCLNGLSAALGDEGRRKEADPPLVRAIAVYERLVADAPTRPDYRHQLANAHHARGLGLNWIGNQAAAEVAFRQSLAISERLTAEYPVADVYRNSTISTLLPLSNMQWDLGRRSDALALLRRAVVASDDLASLDPSSTSYAHLAARTRSTFALRLNDVGEYAAAAAALDRTLADYKRLATDHPGDPQIATEWGGALTYRGRLAFAAGELDAVTTNWHEQAVRMFNELLARDPKHGNGRHRAMIAHLRRAEAHDKFGRYREAATDWQRASDLSGEGLKPALRAGRALSLVKAGDIAKAVAAADELAAKDGVSADTIRYAAAVMAIASAVPSDGDDRLAARAVELLRRIGRDAAVAMMDPDFAPLWERDDFRRLIAGLNH